VCSLQALLAVGVIATDSWVRIGSCSWLDSVSVAEGKRELESEFGRFGAVLMFLW
jgi:hypothetical protein